MLNRYTVKSRIEGSNPSPSANSFNNSLLSAQPRLREACFCAVWETDLLTAVTFASQESFSPSDFSLNLLSALLEVRAAVRGKSPIYEAPTA